MPVTDARLLAVSVLHEVMAGHGRDTGIDKRPVEGRVAVSELGLDSDRQLFRHHGGPDKAVYAYAREDADWWAAELGRDIPPGLLGDNLRTTGLDVSGALIGEVWRVGDVVLEVRMPRTPCENLSLQMGIDRFHVRFNATGAVGALLKVLSPGTVGTGDPIRVEDRPDHDITVADLATGVEASQMHRLLDSGVPLANSVRAKAHRIVARG